MKPLFLLLSFAIISINASVAQTDEVKEKIADFNQDKIEAIELIKKSLALPDSVVLQENFIKA